MKVALITYHADPARGGAEAYTVDLARALAACDHDVTLIHAAAVSGQKAAGVSYVYADGGGLTRTAQRRNFLCALDKRLDAEHFDIVHAMLPVNRCNVYQPHAGFAFETVASGHLERTSPLARAMARLGNRLNAKRQFDAAVERRLLTSQKPPAIICLSQAMKRKVESYIRAGARDVAVIPNAIDLNRYDPALRPAAGAQLREKLGISSAKKVGLFLAQDFSRKGLAETLQAMAALNEPSFVLVIAGRDDPAPFQSLATKLGLTQSVIFAGPTNDPYPFYAAADVVIFPSRSDPFGLVPAEAVAMGVPPIVSRISGVSELLTDGENALIVESPVQIETLAAALRRALDPATNDRMSRNCLATRQMFSYEKHLDSINALYQRRKQERPTEPKSPMSISR